MYQGKGSKNEYADDFGLGPIVVIGLVKFYQRVIFQFLLISISTRFLRWII